MDGKRKTPARLAVAAGEGRSTLPNKDDPLLEMNASNCVLSIPHEECSQDGNVKDRRDATAEAMAVR
jgi:hypothetical protein